LLKRKFIYYILCICKIRGGSRKLVRGWRLRSKNGFQSVFKEPELLSFRFYREKIEKKFCEGWRSPDRLSLDPSLSSVYLPDVHMIPNVLKNLLINDIQMIPDAFKDILVSFNHRHRIFLLMFFFKPIRYSNFIQTYVQLLFAKWTWQYVFNTISKYQGRIQKISEGVAVCRGGSDYDQKTVFKGYLRRQNSSFFVSTEKKLKKTFTRGWRSPDRLPLDPPLCKI
jgi:hypothetical protein